MSGNNEEADEEVFRGIAESNGGQEVTYFKDFPELDLKESLLKLQTLCSHYTSIIKREDDNNTKLWDERLKACFLFLILGELTFSPKKTKWLSVGMSLLKYSGKIVAELEASRSIVVESSDGRQIYIEFPYMC